MRINTVFYWYYTAMKRNYPFVFNPVRFYIFITDFIIIIITIITNIMGNGRFRKYLHPSYPTVQRNVYFKNLVARHLRKLYENRLMRKKKKKHHLNKCTISIIARVFYPVQRRSNEHLQFRITRVIRNVNIKHLTLQHDSQIFFFSDFQVVPSRCILFVHYFYFS